MIQGFMALSKFNCLNLLKLLLLGFCKTLLVQEKVTELVTIQMKLIIEPPSVFLALVTILLLFWLGFFHRLQDKGAIMSI